MNLVQIANELEYVPKEQLAEMSQNPNSRFPQYLVISEIQRRTKNEKAYEAMKQQPTTTVAEEVVNEFIQPKGLQAGIPSGSAPTDVFSPESSGMPASAPMQQPMQMAASGGITGYNFGGPLDFSFKNPNQTNTDETVEVSSIPAEKRAEIVQASQGLTTAQKTALGINAAALALMVTPIPGARVAAGVLKAGQFLGRGISGLRAAAAAKKSKTLMESGKKALDKAGGVPRTTPYNPDMVRQAGIDRIKGFKIPQRLGAGTLAAGSSYALLDPDSPLSLNPNEELQKIETDAEREARLAEEGEAKRLADIQAARDKAAQNNITSLSDFVAAKDKADRRKAGLDMAQLGGVILGSTNLTDLGKGIAGIASNIQTRDAAEGLAGAQKDYYEAQTGKLEAETRMMPAKELRTEIDTYAKYLKTLIEQNDGSEQSVAQITQVQAYINALGERLATMQGYATADSEATRNERLKASGISVT